MNAKAIYAHLYRQWCWRYMLLVSPTLLARPQPATPCKHSLPALSLHAGEPKLPIKVTRSQNTKLASSIGGIHWLFRQWQWRDNHVSRACVSRHACWRYTCMHDWGYVENIPNLEIVLEQTYSGNQFVKLTPLGQNAVKILEDQQLLANPYFKFCRL